jgi:hypothetical protein
MAETISGDRDKIGPSSLRRRFRRLLHDPNTKKKRDQLRTLLSYFGRETWEVYLFGGLLRDIATKGPFALPRDIDLVVGDSTLEEIKLDFRNKVEGENRFGGLSMRFGDWSVDVWPISETWAFKEHWNGGIAPAELPKTTFLNVEAVAMGLSPIPGHGRPVYENGFFDALRERTLSVNFEKNPYPESCIARTFVTAASLRYKIGTDLCEYIYEKSKRIGVGRIIEYQNNHYGRVHLDSGRIEKWIEETNRYVESNKSTPLLLSGAGTQIQKNILTGVQLSLWD